MAWARKLPSGRWQGHYRDKFGRVQKAGRRTFARRSDALKAARDQESRSKSPSWVDPKRTKIAFQEWTDHRMSIAVADRPSTRARDQSYLKSLILPSFGEMSIGEIEPILVQSWVAQLNQTHAPATVAKAYQLSLVLWRRPNSPVSSSKLLAEEFGSRVSAAPR